jgi:type VI secretion system secreted protein Hcp
MAYDAFLKLDGIDGESTDSAHTGWIEIMSFSWGETSAGGGGGSGRGSGKVSFQDFHFSTQFNKASPNIFQACASGKHIPTATLSLAHSNTPSAASGASPDFLKYELSSVLISSYQTGGTLLDNGTYSPIGANGDGFTGDLPVEQFTLNFAKLEIVFTSQVDGSKADVAASPVGFGDGSNSG